MKHLPGEAGGLARPLPRPRRPHLTGPRPLQGLSKRGDYRGKSGPRCLGWLTPSAQKEPTRLALLIGNQGLLGGNPAR